MIIAKNNADDRLVCEWCCENSPKPLNLVSSLKKLKLGKYISTEDAEQILKTFSPGSLMLRGHCYGQYYLSVLKSISIIEHTPILFLGSHYFCMGMRFTSLSDIVRFFSCGSDEFGRLSGLDFVNASVLEDMGNIERFITLHDLQQLEDHQLPLLAGDIISKIGDSKDEIICARNERSGQMGTVHSSLLFPVIDTSKNTNLPYFHPFLLSSALNELETGGVGGFLVKPSSNDTGFLVLLANVGDSDIQQFLIKAEESGYTLCGRRFPTIGHIIDRYCSMPLYHGITLSRGILYSTKYVSSSSSCSCYLTSFSDINTRKYEIVAEVNVLWKNVRSQLWKKGTIILGKYDDASELIMEVKTGRTIKFKSSDSSIYPVDDSVFGRFTCAFIKNSRMGIFLNFRTVTDYLFCVYNFGFSTQFVDRVALLSLSVIKFRSSKVKKSKLYSAECSVDNVNICSFPILPPMFGAKCYGSVVFDQFLLMPFVPAIETAEVSVFVHSETGKESQIFRRFPLYEQESTQVSESQEHLDYSLRIRRIPVLESCCYESFNNWLLNCPMDSMIQISDVMTSQEKNFFCVCVISHFLFRKKMLYQMLRRLMTYSLETSSFDSILRQDSLTTTFLSQLLQILCRTEFIELIREELDENSTEISEDAHISLIIKSLNDLVSQNEILRNILVVICQTTQEHSTESLLLSRKIISVILVLRFACPILLKDKSFSSNVVKQVQVLANKSLLASETDTGSVLTFRQLFDGISKQKFKEESCELYTFPWHGSAALACYMLNISVSRRIDIMSSLPDSLQKLLKVHKDS